MNTSIIRLLALLYSFSALSAYAQVNFDVYPEEYQLFPRDERTNAGTLHVVGTVLGAGAQHLRLELSNAQGVISIQQVALYYGTYGAPFDVTMSIPSTRTNHRLKAYLDTSKEPVNSIGHLVAGDVFVINGQSNAIAEYAIAPADRDSFLRGFLTKNEVGWTTAEYANAGKWMGRTASRLSKEQNVPIAILNFAEGGQEISYFAPEAEGGKGNYEQLLSTLELARVSKNVRALFWYQGEADGSQSASYYTSRLSTLLNEYRGELGPVPVYGFQVRAYSCFGTQPDVMEAQRRISDSLEFLTLLSTINVPQGPDECHFTEVSYQQLGERMADLLSVREYGEAIPGVVSPEIDSIVRTADSTITLYYNTGGVGMAFTGDPWKDFYVGPDNVRPTAGFVEEDQIVLNFSESIAADSTLSYVTALGPNSDAIHNSRGLGAFTFADVPLSAPSIPDTIDTGVSSSSYPLAGANFELFPNPVSSGADLTVELGKLNQADLFGGRAREATFVSSIGQEVSRQPANFSVSGKARLSVPNQPGVYALRIGRASQLVVVE